MWEVGVGMAGESNRGKWAQPQVNNNKKIKNKHFKRLDSKPVVVFCIPTRIYEEW